VQLEGGGGGERVGRRVDFGDDQDVRGITRASALVTNGTGQRSQDIP
jgi:hypothetical protein